MIPLEDALGTPETDDFIAVLTHEPQVPQVISHQWKYSVVYFIFLLTNYDVFLHSSRSLTWFCKWGMGLKFTLLDPWWIPMYKLLLEVLLFFSQLLLLGIDRENVLNSRGEILSFVQTSFKNIYTLLHKISSQFERKKITWGKISSRD